MGPVIDYCTAWYTTQYGHLGTERVQAIMIDHLAPWFRTHVRERGSDLHPSWLRLLARGPSQKVRRAQKYRVNGYKFHTKSFSVTKGTTNSGVSVVGKDNDDNETIWYGTLVDIVQLKYSKNPLMEVVLFRCTWFQPAHVESHVENGLTLVNRRREYPPDYEPFVLAQHASQVYYSPLPGASTHARRKDLLAVCKVKPTSVIDNNEIEEAFQEDPVPLNQQIPHVPHIAERIGLGDPNDVEVVMEETVYSANEEADDDTHSLTSEFDSDDFDEEG